MNRIEEDPSVALSRLVQGYGLSQAVYVAAKLGVPDLLAEGPRGSGELAGATNTNAQLLSRVLRLLAANGVLTVVAADRFALAPLGALLRSDAEGSQRPYTIMTMELEYPAWGRLLHSVTTGQPGFPSAFGRDYWGYLAENPEAAAAFNGAMVGLTRWQADAVVAGYDFSSSQVVVDVGGGHGTLLAAILAANPKVRGVLFDAPQVVEGARSLLEKAGVAGRCSLAGGSFLEEVVEGGDAYVLKWIVHDWDDGHSIKILQNCRRAMTAQGKLLLVESVIPAGEASAQHAQGLWDDVLMMVLFGGRERTADQFEHLLKAAGFRLGDILPVSPELCVIEGFPI